MKTENRARHLKSGDEGKSAFQKVWKAISTVIVTVFVILAVLLGGVRLLGFTPYAVLSGSMTPKYSVGSLVYVQKAEPSEIKVGEVITFVSGRNKVVVTHRVVEVDHTENRFYTNGDANQDRDAAPVAYENVLGRVKFSVPWIGYLSMFLEQKAGRYTALAAFFLLCFLLFLPEFVKAMKEK